MLQPFVQPAVSPSAKSPSDSNVRSIESCSALALAGDRAAIAELHDRLSAGLVRHFARKLAGGASGTSNQDVAEELAQQTWLTFWQAVSNRQYDPSRAKLSTFLYAIAANMWLRHVRQSGRDARIQPVRIATADADDVGEWPRTASGDDPAEAMHTAALLDAVRSAVDGTLAAATTSGSATLAEPERALLRAIGEGMTDRQLAAELGISPSTAHARKRGVLARLAMVLRGQGFSAPEGWVTTGVRVTPQGEQPHSQSHNTAVTQDEQIKRDSQTNQQRLGTT